MTADTVNMEELTKAIEKVAKETIAAELGPYRVDAEQHYKDHLFIDSFRKWYDGIQSSFWKSLVGTLVPAVLLLLIIGAISWLALKAAALSFMEPK